MAETETDVAVEPQEQETAAPEKLDDVDKNLALEAVYDIPIEITVVLGRSTININDLLNLEQGSIVELKRKVGETVDIFVNERLVAKGEVVIVDENIGITLTEIFRADVTER